MEDFLECNWECILGWKCIFFEELSRIKDFLECKNEGGNSKSYLLEFLVDCIF